MDPVTFRLYCLPEQAPVDTTVTLVFGWSPSLNDACEVISAVNIRGDQSSSVAVQAYPEDCIVPEPRGGGLLACITLLALLGRRRANQTP